ncbi:MAG TPA: LysR family transcriptional regulator [Stellaceae bacterium]|nr:LysR family transcriptional regulator [Stellaceae bacterium]
MRRVKLDQLEAFAKVVESGSFRRAAEHLGLTQPAISLRVKELERRFGLRLVERVGRRARATAAGTTLLHHVGRIEEAVAGAFDALAPHARGIVGRVRIGTGATACTYLLPPLLAELRRRRPELEIVVSTGNTPSVLEALEDNRIDVGFVTLPVAGRSVAVIPLLADEIVAVFAREEDAPRGPVEAALLTRLPVIVYEPGGSLRRVIDDWHRAQNITLKAFMELGNIEAIKGLVANGLGCGLLPRMAVPGIAGRVLAVRSLSPRLHRRLAMILRRDKVPDRALSEVIALLAGIGAPTR